MPLAHSEPTPEACRAVQKAALDKAWEIIEGPLRIAARDLGYAITHHGSRARDLDIVAIAWREHNVATPDHLVQTLVGVLRGIFGRANQYNEWTDKPHGRKAKTILLWGGQWSIDIDLSLIPPVEKPKEEE